MTDAALTGDYKTAARLQNSLVRINPLMYEEGNPGGIKEVLELMGIIKNHLRLPLVPVSDSLRSKISNALQEIKKG
jgi:4-hydroxy-tetrahydrodipicolinate synthase